MAKKTGVVLMNLGSPDSTEVKDVRKYLKQFLMVESLLAEFFNSVSLNFILSACVTGL